jgi:hypothetical protein
MTANDPLDDVTVDITDVTTPETESRHLLKRRLRGVQSKTVSVVAFDKQFPAPRRLDIGAGYKRERGWIAVDVDARTSPDVHADAQSLMIADDSVHEIRMISALGCFQSPARALSEAWRVLCPGASLTIVEAYSFSTDALPTQHHFSTTFWRHVTQDAVTEYVPTNANGRWMLASYRREAHRNMIDQVCRKLKFTEEQAISLMPSLVKRQVVVLTKGVF